MIRRFAFVLVLLMEALWRRCFGFVFVNRPPCATYSFVLSLSCGSGFSKLDHLSDFRLTNITVQNIFVAHVETLRDRFPSFEDSSNDETSSHVLNYNQRRHRENRDELNECDVDDTYCNADSHVANLQFNELVEDDEVVLVDTVHKNGMQSVTRAFPRAGPRKTLHFDPSKVNAAVLSAGGLCCGVNNIVRELVHSLYYLYGANKVYGIQGGFHGFHNPDYPPVVLTTALMENIHHEGGTILGSSRGGFDINKILAFIDTYRINQLFVIGGDGTHRAANAIHQACMDLGLELSVAGIPKTIDK
jgi:6-phosphofructokinase 1